MKYDWKRKDEGTDSMHTNGKVCGEVIRLGRHRGNDTWMVWCENCNGLFHSEYLVKDTARHFLEKHHIAVHS